MLQLFQTKKGSIFSSSHLYTVVAYQVAFPYIMHCIHLSRFFGASSENICPIHYLKYIVYRCNSCFRQRRAQFFHRHTCIQWLHSFSLYNALYTLVTLFWCFIRKYLSHTLYCAQLVSVCFTLNLCILLLNTLSTDVTVVSDKEGLNFFIITRVYSGCIVFPYIMHLYTLVTLFWCFIRKYLSHTFYCAQFVSVCFTLKVCFCL